MKGWNRKKGFTLIEIAIVLIILGILIMLGATLMGPLVKRAKYTETKEIVDAASESVTGYAITSGKLPPLAGDTTFRDVVGRYIDPWGKPLYYIYDEKLEGDICSHTITATNITVSVCPNAACSSPTSTTKNVAFVVLSGDGNYNNQTAGNEKVTSSKTINVYEAGVPNIDNYPGDMNRPEDYDDVVKWVSLYELKTKLGCTGPGVLCPSYTVEKVPGGGYKLSLDNFATCRTREDTFNVPAGTIMEVYGKKDCKEEELEHTGAVEVLDKNGDCKVKCSSKGDCK